MLQTIGCSSQNENVKKFGVNANYFLGLKLLEQNNEKEAALKFNKCIKKSDKLFAKKSAQQLCTFGTISEKNSAAIYLAENFFDDKQSLLIALQHFFQTEEYSSILKYTQNLNFQEDLNEIIKLRLFSLKKLDINTYEQETFEWFTTRPISKEHYLFYRDTYNHPDFVNLTLADVNFYDLMQNNNTFQSFPDNSDENQKDNLDFSDEIESLFENEQDFINQYVINFRVELYKRNYTYAHSQAQNIINLIKKGKIQISAQLASDLGKTYLYASSNFKENAQFFTTLAADFKSTPMEFYFWFYAGRFYEKTKVYYQKSKECFEKAINSTTKESQKDNALWYLLTTMMNYSIEELVNNMDFYARQFYDPSYFDDFFDTLSVTLLSLGKWNSFKTVYEKADGYATKESVSKFAYIYARLCQEKIAEGGIADKKQIEQALLKACDCGSDIYYKILAAYELGLNEQELQNLLLSSINSADFTTPSVSDSESKSAALLMEGYVTFGFPDLIYPQWQELFSYLPEKTNFYLADFLYRCGKTDETNTFYTQSLRIASKAFTYSTQDLTPAEMQLVFPKCYSQPIEKYANEYMLPPNVMYALIRSESFFEPGVKSSVGAVGLTQLMEFTANDVAKKLKLSDYSLTDVETNIRIGTFYLAELLQRCDNSLILAFFSYNAGITRVRRWLKSSLAEYGKKSSLPMDLFLESLPYSETREYGRKLLSATVMYAYLENPTSFSETVTMLLGD